MRTMLVRSCALLLAAGVILPREVSAVEVTVTKTYDTYAVWGWYQQGITAYTNRDWVTAEQALTLAWEAYNQLRGNPDSPFAPIDRPEFKDLFWATVVDARQKVGYFVRQLPDQMRAAGESALASCESQLPSSRGHADRPSPFWRIQFPSPSQPPLPPLPPPR